MEDLLVLASGHFLFFQFLPPASRHQEKYVMSDSTQLDGQFQDSGELLGIFLGYRGIDLEFKACLFQGLNSSQSPAKGSSHLAKTIVALFRSPVQAYGDPLNPAGLQAGGIFGIQESPIKSDGHPKPPAGSIAGQIVDILAQQGLSPRENDYGFAKGNDLIDQTQGLFRTQFARVRTSPGGSPAMDTIQVATPGHFPGNHPNVRNRLCRVSLFLSLHDHQPIPISSSVR
jgi:hypothetical protein